MSFDVRLADSKQESDNNSPSLENICTALHCTARRESEGARQREIKEQNSSKFLKLM